jgi:phosphoribosylaminoimidazolecarboxamide formyltransferase / IMP cyclohydrolase
MFMKPIRRALVSVSDKTNLIPFAQFLSKNKVEIISTGGTLKALKEAGVPAKAVDEVTGFPEILEGRVKTLHPKIHGGLLYRRDKESHASQARAHGIEAIDLVVVNLYPFEKVTQNAHVEFETAIENIDIGGPSMLRSAAKNFEAVTVVCDPADYPTVIQEMQKHKGKVSASFNKHLALKVFARTAAYDKAISDYLSSQNGKASIEPAAPSSDTAQQALPLRIDFTFEKAADLRYGENPHQPAALYVSSAAKKSAFKQLGGKELSFNNYLDIDGAIDVISEFDAPAACVIKHSNPCGAAEGKDIPDALERAIESDAMSAFGGIIGINRRCDLAAAQMAFEKLKFFEVFVAPEFDQDAVDFMMKRQNLRLIETGKLSFDNSYDYRFLRSGILLQTRDLPLKQHLAALKKNLKFVTKAKLKGDEIENLLFAFKCVKVVKSNAIVLTQGRQTVGIGAGQMSRVDSVEIACSKAGYRTEDAFLASDAFFPMPDAIEYAGSKKIRAIIQPGGSIKDLDVIAACDKFGIAMAFTGERHFRH